MNPREIVFVVVVTIAVFAVTFWILRSVRGKGTREDFSVDAAALMGHRIILGDGGDKVIARVLGYNTGIRHVGTNLWSMKVDQPDDVLIEWIPNPERGSGGKLLIAHAVDKDGVPTGYRQWRKLLDTISTFSGESLVMTDRSIGAPLVKSDLVVEGREVWLRSKD